MATSRLTVRTLALATVALVLACAKAAIGEPGGVVPRASKAAGTLSPGSPTAGANVGTVTSNGGSGGSRSIGTVTSARGSSVGSVATVLSDHRSVITRAGNSSPQPQARPSTSAAKPSGRAPARPSATAKTGPAGDLPPITVRRVTIGPQRDEPAAEPAPAIEPEDPKVRAALRTEAVPRSMSRNAFSLGTSALGQFSPP